MIYNFICKLKGVDLKYKVEAENVTDAMIKVRNHIKNAVEITEVQKIEKPKSDFIDFFNETILKK